MNNLREEENKCPCPVLSKSTRVSTPFPFSDDDNDNKTNRWRITWIKAYVSMCYHIKMTCLFLSIWQWVYDCETRKINIIIAFHEIILSKVVSKMWWRGTSGFLYDYLYWSSYYDSLCDDMAVLSILWVFDRTAALDK